MRCKGLFCCTCHEDLEQISSILSVELIFIYFIYTIVPGSGLVDAMVAAHY